MAGRAKSELQEFLSKNQCSFPDYEVVSQSGPSHLPCFAVKVHVDWYGYHLEKTATGHSRKSAESNAAYAMLEEVKKRRLPTTPPKVTKPNCSGFSHLTAQNNPKLAGTAKSDLQEFLQKRSCPCPVYREVSRTGSAHIPTFVMSVTAEFNGEVTMKKGVARGKKEAEKEAARAMLAHFGVVPSGSSSGPSVAIDDDDDGLSSDPRDTAKNDLQHKCQSSAQPLPVYETEMTGVRFATVVKVLWAGREYQEVGTGLTKKQAEKDAAYNMLQILPVSSSKLPAAPQSHLMAAKNRLQEMTQKLGYPNPEYSEVEDTNTDGEEYVPSSCMRVVVRNNNLQVIAEEIAVDKTKKVAEKMAAYKVLKEAEKIFGIEADLPEDEPMESDSTPYQPDPVALDRQAWTKFCYKLGHQFQHAITGEPHTIFQKGEDRRVILCLTSVPTATNNFVTAYGTGSCEREALKNSCANLLESLSHLYDS